MPMPTAVRNFTPLRKEKLPQTGALTFHEVRSHDRMTGRECSRSHGTCRTLEENICVAAAAVLEFGEPWDVGK